MCGQELPYLPSVSYELLLSTKTRIIKQIQANEYEQLVGIVILLTFLTTMIYFNCFIGAFLTLRILILPLPLGNIHLTSSPSP